MKLLINASNLHIGGGIQVASSFITELGELLNLIDERHDISVICSEKVYANLPVNFDKTAFRKFNILNVHGIKQPPTEVKEQFKGFDVCFTIFGPLYFSPEVKYHICGFAQPWIAYPKNIAYKKLSLLEYLKFKLKFNLQLFLFKRYDHLIVEQIHIKSALSELGFKSDDISVVSNCVSSIYDDPNRWKALNFQTDIMPKNITLGFIGRAYSHKNVFILNQVNDILISKYQMKCNFLFTFTSAEMKLCGFEGHDNFYSVGEIEASQCPNFYNALDALIFPSLLECFSASPIEAMKMNTTVIASNYPFVKEVCGDSAFYFDPLSADSIASSIFEAFANNELREDKKRLGLELVALSPTAKDRAASYLNIIKNSIKSNY
ncbi:glycosyltransferase [Providencia huaxiensis]|uniref:glycosyltransferase n=1 Tax=Providencia huaxiensis TaxID=2027290 RepID=UPI0034E445BE